MTSPRARPTRRIRPAVLACALLASGGIAEAGTEPARPRPTAWQEIVLLTVMKVRHAAANCGFQVNRGQIDAFLASSALGETDVERQAFSPALKRQIGADADLYLDAKDAACAQAWDRYGPDGAPGIRDTLRR